MPCKSNSAQLRSIITTLLARGYSWPKLEKYAKCSELSNAVFLVMRDEAHRKLVNDLILLHRKLDNFKIPHEGRKILLPFDGLAPVGQTFCNFKVVAKPGPFTYTVDILADPEWEPTYYMGCMNPSCGKQLSYMISKCPGSIVPGGKFLTYHNVAVQCPTCGDVTNVRHVT